MISGVEPIRGARHRTLINRRTWFLMGAGGISAWKWCCQTAPHGFESIIEADTTPPLNEKTSAVVTWHFPVCSFSDS